MVGFTGICIALGLGVWLGAAAGAAALGAACILAGAVASKRQGVFAALDVGVLGVIGAISVIAVERLYAVRHEYGRGPESTTTWIAAIILMAVLPAVAGALRGRSSPLALSIAAALCLSPAAFRVLEQFDKVPDVIFLFTGSAVAFISTGWTVSFFRGRRWFAAVATCVLLPAAGLWVTVVIWFILYFE